MLSALLALAAVAQSPSAAPAFDVASIRSAPPQPSMTHELSANVKTTPESVTMRNVTLRAALAWAYDVMEYQVDGPMWLGLDRYDIVAKTPDPAPESRLRAMLQPTLGDRFRLTFHRETKERQAFLLTVGKNGPKFHESQTGGESSIEPNKERMAIVVKRAPVSQLVYLLSNVLQTPVVDQTGLKGRYDVTFDVAKYMQDMRSSDGPPDILAVLMAGVQEELGLKLESKKIPLDLIVIDHAEKIPEAN